jgi:hypothetical protein
VEVGGGADECRRFVLCTTARLEEESDYFPWVSGLMGFDSGPSYGPR